MISGTQAPTSSGLGSSSLSNLKPDNESAKSVTSLPWSKSNPDGDAVDIYSRIELRTIQRSDGSILQHEKLSKVIANLPGRKRDYVGSASMQSSRAVLQEVRRIWHAVSTFVYFLFSDEDILPVF